MASSELKFHHQTLEELISELACVLQQSESEYIPVQAGVLSEILIYLRQYDTARSMIGGDINMDTVNGLRLQNEFLKKELRKRGVTP